ncbi:DUF5518 domain-containing protein [Haloarchaeobius baliensis]|uniref:DUF5518 domain-containing protein n=1 Tax=Haloarchaeobius baliensis TaxID=1670458 RepID=UPI003F88582E
MSQPLHRRRQDAWTYALVGGLAAAPLVVAHNLYTGLGTEFSLNALLVGGLVAGFLARRASADADRAAAGAGVLGGLPALAWFLPAMLASASSFATAWSFPPAGPLLVAVFGLVVLTIFVVTGLLGGLVGKWLASFVDRRTATHG